MIWKFLPLLLALQAQATASPVILVDSSFPPATESGLGWKADACRLLREDNAEVPEQGDCFDRATWEELGTHKPALLRGLMDSLAKLATPEAEAYQAFQAAEPAAAKRLRGGYLLAVHGTRAASVLLRASDGKASVVPVRVLTAQGGALQQASATQAKAAFPLHGGGCGLRKWTEAEKRQIEKGGRQDHQRRIEQALAAQPKARVVSISLGYRRAWIAEDNPGCGEPQVGDEFEVLRGSWRGLLRAHPAKLFVVAAGNEGTSLDGPASRADDLWASLQDEPNLLLVGSLQAGGGRLPSSNFGAKVAMAKGEEIRALSPLPGGGGHETTLRGTSFSAPIAAGLAVKLWSAEAKLTLAQLREKLLKELEKAK